MGPGHGPRNARHRAPARRMELGPVRPEGAAAGARHLPADLGPLPAAAAGSRAWRTGRSDGLLGQPPMGVDGRRGVTQTSLAKQRLVGDVRYSPQQSTGAKPARRESAIPASWGTPASSPNRRTPSSAAAAPRPVKTVA